ncbi:MAG TPA: hypothetical protein VK943_01130 [Arenibaculum sp.]|nr:hypothetical protein [Arenibaculum sp.]
MSSSSDDNAASGPAASDPAASDPRAARLRRAREHAGYASADQAADAFGWPGYAVDESGERPLTPVRARLYAHAFHVELEWLLSGDGGPDAVRTEPTGAASGTAQPTNEPADELAERIGRLTGAQRTALAGFLRAMQDG